MKKLLLLTLTAALVFTLAVPAFAESEFVSPVAGAGTTVSECWIEKMPADSTATFMKEIEKLEADQQATFQESAAALNKGKMQNFSVKYLFYYIPGESVKNAANPEDAYILVNTVHNARVTALQYQNGSWNDLETEYDAVKNILTIKNALEEGPIVLGGTTNASPAAPVSSSKKTSYLPLVVDAPEASKAVSVLEAADLSAAAQKAFTGAQAALGKAVPAGMAARYFFYLTSDTDPAELAMKVIDVTEAAVKQFQDGKWVDLESVLNGDVLTAQSVGDGPVAVFTK